MTTRLASANSRFFPFFSRRLSKGNSAQRSSVVVATLYHKCQHAVDPVGSSRHRCAASIMTRFSPFGHSLSLQVFSIHTNTHSSPSHLHPTRPFTRFLFPLFYSTLNHPHIHLGHFFSPIRPRFTRSSPPRHLYRLFCSFPVESADIQFAKIHVHGEPDRVRSREGLAHCRNTSTLGCC